MSAPPAFSATAKAKVPLSLTIGLWLALNLLLLVVAGLAVFWMRGRPSKWLESAVGDRLRIVSDSVVREMRGTSAEEQEAILARYAAEYGLSFGLFLNSGVQVVGPKLDLPTEVRERLDPTAAPARSEDGPPPLRPPPPPRRDGERPLANRLDGGERPGPPPPRDRELNREREREQARAAERANGRIFLHTVEPTQWWAGDRVPVTTDEARPPTPGVLLAVGPSPWAYGRLLGLPLVLGAVGMVLVLSVLFWLPLVAGMTRALRTLMQATERIALGRFDTRVPTERRDEIGRLGESINHMAARLEHLVGGQKKFLADVAHELGSPVGRLQVGTSILEERVPPELRPAVADVREEVEQMSALIAELLAFTRAGHRAAELPLTAVRLASVVTQAVVREGAGRAIMIEVGEDLVVTAEESLLTRAVSNLVRNAVRYAGETAQISIAAAAFAGERVRLRVADDGPGVPADMVARLGEPFFRPDAARTREAGGTGLGLSIMKEAVEAMAGTVTFANGEPRGFVAEIELSGTKAPNFTSP